MQSCVDDTRRCTGCGVCAARCPAGSIAMRWNEYGEYQPRVARETCVECGLCREVCPMLGRPGTGVPSDLFGRFTRQYVAHAADERSRVSSASGGVITQLLLGLFAGGQIDGAVCAAMTGSDKPYFTPTVCRTPAETSGCRGSKYYPLEYSGVLREIAGDGRKYAVVCLPCVADGIDRLRRADPRYEGIRHIVCITCGHNKTAGYLDFLLRRYGCRPPLREVRFRGKSDQPFSNYLLQVTSREGATVREHFHNGFIGRLWGGFFFAQRGCVGCRDLFGTAGDVSCMDAWLYPYNNSRKGYNIVLARADFADQHVAGVPGILSKPLPREDVVLSQRVVYGLKSRGETPGDLLANMEASEGYARGEFGYDDLVALIGSDPPWRRVSIRRDGAIAAVKELIKTGIGYYENIVRR